MPRTEMIPDSTYRIFFAILWIAVILQSCGDAPESEEPPWVLTHVELTPEYPTFADTVRIEAMGEQNPYGPENGDAVEFYKWIIDSRLMERKEENSIYWFNDSAKDTVLGWVWGRFKSDLSPVPSTGTIQFEIIYQQNGENNE